MKQSEYSNAFQNLKKILLLLKRNSKYIYQNQTDRQFLCQKGNSIYSSKGRQYGTLSEYLLALFEGVLFQITFRTRSLDIVAFYGKQQIEDTLWQQCGQLGDLDEQEEHRFQQQMANIFSQSYLKEPITNKIASLNRRNWLQYNFLIWKSNLELKDQKCKLVEIYTRIKRSRAELGANYYKLKREQKILQSLAASREQKSQISNQGEIQQQIEKLQAQRSKVVASNKQILQITRQKIYEQMPQLQHQTALSREKIIKRDLKIAEMVVDIEQELKYIKIQINIMQNKQIAESFSKLTKKQEGNKELIYTVYFQQALNLKCEKYGQTVFKFYDNLRDNSLQNGCFVGRKSRFNYLSQNLQKFPSQITKRVVQTEFEQMQICHQCKNFNKKQKMRKCGYNSAQYGKPRPKFAAYDNYISQILKNLPKNDKQRLQSEITPSYYYRYKFDSKLNTTVESMYTCNRYYCNVCMKAYNFDKKIQLCPFCVGVCHCSRCVRHQNIFKLKTLYLRLGGNLQELQESSEYKQFIQVNDLNQKSMNIETQSHESDYEIMQSCPWSPSKSYRTMKCYQKQLTHLQILIYLTIRRQKLKKKLVQCRRRMFKQQYQKLVQKKGQQDVVQEIIK